ncbi:C40 family peptidase [Shewanella maritima]|uniref:C40 family peptidase n=1 Tax=Shewanella maritima TaxID=2520507 RepID=UPI0037357F47
MTKPQVSQAVNLLIVFVLASILSACSSVTPEKPYHAASQQWNKANLNAFYQHWQGTPYRLGGLDKRGMDCSGFVYLAHQSILGSYIPRTVEGQTDLGNKIDKSQLLVGDLVFFKTSWRGRHVGIYMGNGQFMHVSTKRGVMMSRMDNVYWQPRFWFASRIAE